MPRWAAKVDNNQGEIVEALRQVGASVLVLSRVGMGCADLAVGFRGVTYFLEIKNDKGKLTPAEKEFMDEWNGHYCIVHTVDEALQAIGATYWTDVTGCAKGEHVPARIISPTDGSITWVGCQNCGKELTDDDYYEYHGEGVA